MIQINAIRLAQPRPAGFSRAKMKHDYDPDYYNRREQICRKLAEQATDPAVARVHREMAEKYAKLARTSERAKLRVIPG